MILPNQFSYSGTDEINEILFRDSNLQMTKKFKIREFKPSKLNYLSQKKTISLQDFQKLTFETNQI